MIKSFDELLKKVSQCETKKVAVGVAQDDAVLEAVIAAKERKIANAVLVGDVDKINAVAKESNLDISSFEIIDVKDDYEAALTAVKLVHDGKADMYMKGLIDTKSFLKSVLDKEVGLRTDKTLSHVCVCDFENQDRLFFLADVAFIPYPDLETKANIIRNSVEIAKCFENDNPKVAVLAAVEVVNPKMPATVEADALSKMNDNGEITGCIVDGPLSYDLATCPEAAKHKGAEDRKIVGDADIFIFPDIQAGNIFYKASVHDIPGVNGNILTGTKAPVILTSRSDDFETKVNSLAVGAWVAETMNK